jgi:hypothetical protein
LSEAAPGLFSTRPGPLSLFGLIAPRRVQAADLLEQYSLRAMTALDTGTKLGRETIVGG